jgi:hypothetical protein
MADKFDSVVETFVAAAPADERDQARAVFSVFADLGRAIEQISEDLDRIATALEAIAGKLNG